MGKVVSLDQWRVEHAKTAGDGPTAFFFDLGCPLSYLSAERVERSLGAVSWIPADTAVVRGGSTRRDREHLRHRAISEAGALRLPLVWPERNPGPTPRALRAAAYAAEIGAGARFALAASRLAFCGGFDLDDPEALAEAAAASGVPLAECLQAASDPGWDATLLATARVLQARGVRELPAFRVGRRWFWGESGLTAAASVVRRPAVVPRPMAPVG